MSTSAKAVLKDALRLPASDRAVPSGSRKQKIAWKLTVPVNLVQ